MFGFILPNLNSLGEEEKARYQAVYCGVCRSIRARYGQRCRITVSYDMTFMAMVLGSMYEPVEHAGQKRCPVHLLKPQVIAQSEITDYAADLSVALAYHKLMDDWLDDRSAKARAAAAAIAVPYKKAKRRQPVACEAIEQAMAKIHEIEQQGLALWAGNATPVTGAVSAAGTAVSDTIVQVGAGGAVELGAVAGLAGAVSSMDTAAPARTDEGASGSIAAGSVAPEPSLGNFDPDAAANCFGMLLGSLFAWKNDFWATDLRRFGARLGKFVYAMDAAMDMRQDQIAGSYNPFLLMGRENDDLREDLELLAASMAEAFERLPLERDVHVLRSVLYSGVWQRFNAKESKEHGEGPL